jgi:predicted ABC-type ATPase
MVFELVAQRVKQGGHHIPEDVILRRFAAGHAYQSPKPATPENKPS